MTDRKIRKEIAKFFKFKKAAIAISQNLKPTGIELESPCIACSVNVKFKSIKILSEIYGAPI